MADGATGDGDIAVIRQHHDPVESERLPGLTALPVVLPTYWGPEEARVRAGTQRSEAPGADSAHRGYRADGTGAGFVVTVVAAPVYPETVRAREDDEPVTGAVLDVTWSTDPSRLRGSVLVAAPDDSGIAAAVTVVAEGLSREHFGDVLRSLRVVGA